MEKLMYLLWKKRGQSNEAFRDDFLEKNIPTLHKTGVSHLRFNVVDEAVAPAHKLYIHHVQPAPDALLSFWLPTAITRRPQETILQSACNKINGYLVTESEPLVNQKYPAQQGQRTYGMNQVVLLKKPEKLNFEEWIDIWHNSHTQIAIETQATFGYRQNVVTRLLTRGAIPLNAIVEENFPPEAMTSAHAFYNAKDDDTLMKKNQSRMFASVQRFIEFDQLDCLPMSEYNYQ